MASFDVTRAEFETLKMDIDMWYLTVMGILVFFMQAGFALLEAGSVRAKNTKNILMKNLLDACIGALVWWAWGYAVAYDGTESGFIGTGENGMSFFHIKYNEAAYSGDDNTMAYANWWFQYVFCAAAATIVSGAMAERTTLVAYLVYTVIISGLIYPVVVHWSWHGNGWAVSWNGGLLDFAGSGIVHMTGGIAALIGAAVVGPRKGRFDESKKPLPMPAHNTTFQVLGTFILWIGWYGFNPGSTLALTGGNGHTMSRCVTTTTLSAATGGLTVLFLDKCIGSKTWDVGMLCNGILAGLVSITAGTATVYPYAAIIIGFCGGCVYKMTSFVVLKVCKVDDPLDAFAVHGACGFWGVMAAALFAIKGFASAHGVFEGGENNWDYLGAGFVFCLTDVVWTGSLSLMMFLPMKFAGILRVSAEMEEQGMDVSKHGGAAYVNDSK